MTTNIQKIKNYLQLSKLTAEERDTYEQIRQTLVNNPDAVSKITEKYAAFNHYTEAYYLDADIKLVMGIKRVHTYCLLPFGDNHERVVYLYDAYAAMPDGTFIDMKNTKRAELLLNTAKKITKKSKAYTHIPMLNGKDKFIDNFIGKYNTR